MAKKLTEITTHYHTFVDNQVLTKDQLNQFIGYFEDQDRLSRVFLHGVGIVCGFKPGLNSDGKKITITQGVGVTTDGDLIQLKKAVPDKPFKSIDLEKLEFGHYKKFEDNAVGYSFFRKTVGEEEQVMDLQEIFPEEVENSKPLEELSDWKNKVVLLYLESFPKEGDLCTTTNCDNQGVEQVARLRVLLVSKTDAEIIAGKDSVFSKHNTADSYSGLPEVAVRRVVLNEANSSSYDELKRAFQKVLSDNQLQTNLENGIKKIVNDFGAVLQLKDIDLNSALNQLKNIMVFSNYNVPFNVQYRYDCVKDIAETYHEIKCLLSELKEECNPDISAFPKHLLLGNINEINSDVKHNRHAFYKSPAFSNRSEKINKCKNLVIRLFEIIKKFQTKPGDVKLTPSNKMLALSSRAVPYYYAVDDELLKSWNFSKTEIYESDTNLSYHTDQLASNPSVQEPLAYSIDKYNFFRIEGHQGKDYRLALQQVDGLKRKYGLAFDVKALSVNINTENLNIDDYECEFEDLQVMLRAWTAEQDCILAEMSAFFSAFNLKEPGVNSKEQEYDEALHGRAGTAGHLNRPSETEWVYNLDEGMMYNATMGYQPYNYYKQNTVVIDNLTTNENALGNTMKKAFDETKGGSVNDTIARAKILVENQIDSEAWKEHPEMRALVIDDSVELMVYANKLAEIMPGQIRGMDVTRVDTYKLTLSELCKLVKKLRARYQSTELSENMKSFTQLLITQLSSVCCSGKKLEVLNEEINKRKEGILLRLQLAKFVEKHPGLEHMAGVLNGGTFVLVYLNKVEKPLKERESTANEVAANRNIREEMSGGSSETHVREIRNWQPGVAEEMTINERYGVNEISREMMERLKSLEKNIQKIDIPNNTVVADFALPYLCCSDCAPVNFIVPKAPVFLRLETDTFCIGKDKSPLIFEVSPDDGNIKADPETAGVSIDGTKLSIDAGSFPEDMLGKPVKFTVNDQVTDVQLTIYQGVEFDFEVPESPTSETEITFKPTGNLDGASFLWSFGDDNMSTERNPTHRYRLAVNEENKVTVSLTVTAANGVCSSTVEHEIRFEAEEEEVQIALEEKDYCENDKQPYPFKILPEGADAKIEGKGVLKNSNGNFVFIPANAEAGQHSFQLNGNPSGITVTVHEAPAARFEPKQVNNLLVITNNSTGADSYIWKINEEIIERSDTSQVEFELTPNSPTNWIIELTAVSKECGQDSTEQDFTTEIEGEPPNCIEETIAAIRKDLQELSQSNVPNSNFVVPIWKSTSELYGGTADFNQGVLDDADNFLNGKNNGKLAEMFVELLQQTAQMIVEVRDENPEEAKVLITLFALQLRLFYNILSCQDQEMINASADEIKQVLGMILDLLRFLKNKEIILPDNLREFMQAMAEKMKEIPLLNEHFKTIKEEKLI